MSKMIRRHDPRNFGPGRIQDEVNRLFDRVFGSSRLLSGGSAGFPFQVPGVPRVRFEETENEYVILAELSGLDPKDVIVEIEGRTIVLRNETTNKMERREAGFHSVAYARGAFYRTFVVPEDGDTDGISVNGSNGALTIIVPKNKRRRSRRLTLDASGS